MSDPIETHAGGPSALPCDLPTVFLRGGPDDGKSVPAPAHDVNVMRSIATFADRTRKAIVYRRSDTEPDVFVFSHDEDMPPSKGRVYIVPVLAYISLEDDTEEERLARMRGLIGKCVVMSNPGDCGISEVRFAFGSCHGPIEDSWQPQ